MYQHIILVKYLLWLEGFMDLVVTFVIVLLAFVGKY